MGQQQLLLIVLGVIIVGVAIVAGIGLFNAGAEEAAKDEIVAQSMAIGANAQQFYKKPLSMGGGGGTWTNAKNADYTIPTKMATTENGTYTGAISTNDYVITGTPKTVFGYKWKVTCTVSPTNISTTVDAVQ